jgi:hypothetical protein
MDDWVCCRVRPVPDLEIGLLVDRLDQDVPADLKIVRVRMDADADVAAVSDDIGALECPQTKIIYVGPASPAASAGLNDGVIDFLGDLPAILKVIADEVLLEPALVFDVIEID